MVWVKQPKRHQEPSEENAKLQPNLLGALYRKKIVPRVFGVHLAFYQPACRRAHQIVKPRLAQDLFFSGKAGNIALDGNGQAATREGKKPLIYALKQNEIDIAWCWFGNLLQTENMQQFT